MRFFSVFIVVFIFTFMLSPQIFRRPQRFEGLARRFVAVGQRPERRRVCLGRSRLIFGHVLVLLIGAHSSVPAHFISPTKFGLQEPKDFGSHGRILYRKNTRPAWGITLPDRKSTRLNSSHLGISYAVFCLKKKD